MWMRFLTVLPSGTWMKTSVGGCGFSRNAAAVGFQELISMASSSWSVMVYPSTALFRLTRPLEGVTAGRLPASVGVHVPALAVALGVDCHDHALASERLGSPRDDLRILEGCSIDGHFVRAG